MKFEYREFSERPLSDSCWSVQTGPDGRVYLACCTEHTGGETATVVRWDELNGKLEYLFDLDEVTGDLRDSGRATQCKIHYSFIPDCGRGILYAATHLSGPPKGEKSYNPWASWNDPARAFRGSYLISFDTASDTVLESRLMIPKEGCRCLAFDHERQVLYAVTYPRDHFVSYHPGTGVLRDFGRIGSVNTQCIFLDDRGRAYLFDDAGRMVRFDPDGQRLEELSHVYPHESYQSSWHGVLYDAVKDPASGAIYMIPWKAHGHLARFWPSEGSDGRIEDLGPASQPRDTRKIVSVNIDHVGGLIWGADSRLYMVRTEWSDIPHSRRATSSVLVRFDPANNEWESLGRLFSDIKNDHYVSRGALSARGNMVFGKVSRPCGAYLVTVPDHPREPTPDQYIRSWG